MPDTLSVPLDWTTHIEPLPRREILLVRPDDPRLGEVIVPWRGDTSDIRLGRPVLLGFPQDEGVRRNQGRPGAAEAPREIRHWLYRLCPADAVTGTSLTVLPPLDLGNVRIRGSLEESQTALAEVVAALLTAGAVPIILGGGHETALGSYLGYVRAIRPVGLVNLDAHLDLRPRLGELGHSGSPFRQALEHPAAPLPGDHYVCLGAQPFAVSRAHVDYAVQKGCVIHWCEAVRGRLEEHFERERQRLAADGSVHLSLDADVVHLAEVPGVSAPNADGLAGHEVLRCVRRAGASPTVAGFEVVEVNPRHDPDGRSSRWAALAVWAFLIGLAERSQ
jgi:formiminoglutamase